jgi:hypothetical protein
MCVIGQRFHERVEHFSRCRLRRGWLGEASAGRRRVCSDFPVTCRSHCRYSSRCCSSVSVVMENAADSFFISQKARCLVGEEGETLACLNKRTNSFAPLFHTIDADDCWEKKTRSVMKCILAHFGVGFKCLVSFLLVAVNRCSLDAAFTTSGFVFCRGARVRPASRCPCGAILRLIFITLPSPHHSSLPSPLFHHVLAHCLSEPAWRPSLTSYYLSREGTSGADIAPRGRLSRCEDASNELMPL